MALWRWRVRSPMMKYPHLLSGMGCMLVLLLLLSAFPAETVAYICAFSAGNPVAAADGLGPVTAGGRYAAVVRDGPDGIGVYLQDHQAGREHWIGRGKSPAVTPDGRYVAFLTRDDRLAPGGLQRDWDIVLYDRVRLRYELVTVRAEHARPGDRRAGRQRGSANELSAPSISADGRFVAFSSSHDDLALGGSGGVSQVYLRDRRLQTTLLLTSTPAGLPVEGPSWQPRISADGREISFHSDDAWLQKEAGDSPSVRCRLVPAGGPVNRPGEGLRARVLP